MIFENIKKEFNLELSQINYFIKNNLKSEINLIDNIGSYLIEHNGKRIRPIINILFGKILKKNDEKNIIISSAIELIHTATLLHDDVVDLSDKRRGKLSVNKVWGNKEAILVGDYLYTKAFKMMVNLNSIEILHLMSHTTNTMSEGEINQLINRKNFNITEEDYFKIIISKTATLFSASSLSSAILAKSCKKNQKYAHNFGIHFGIAYQLIDDMLDYFTDDEKFGKNMCDDITTGTFTLPLIKLLMNDNYKKKIIIDIILNKTKKDYFKIKNLVIQSNTLDYTYKLATYHIDKAKKALSNFDQSKFTNIAYQLSDFILKRKY